MSSDDTYGCSIYKLFVTLHDYYSIITDELKNWT